MIRPSVVRLTPPFRAMRELLASARLSCYKISLLFALLVSLIFSLATSAQTTGTPPFGSFGGGPDLIDFGNLNARLAIPLMSKAGRGMNFAPYVLYNTLIWSPVTSNGTTTWTPAFNYGWSGSDPLVGSVGSSVSISFISCPGHFGVLSATYTNWAYMDGLGTPHPFPGTSTQSNACLSPTGFTSTATDGSGYTITVSGQSVTSLYSSTGNLIVPGTSIQDRNGNKITLSSGAYTDTLGTTALTISGSGTSASPKLFTFTPPNTSLAKCGSTNGVACFTLNYTNYTVATNFGISTIGEYKSSASVPLVTSLVLPDGSQYSFTYEPTPGSCTPYSGTTCTTARLASVTLPTGGAISYLYYNSNNNFSACTTGNNGIFSDGSTSCILRTTPDGPWTYTRSQVSGNHWQTKVTTPPDPQNQGSVGDDTVIDFQKDSATASTNNFYETQRVAYQGASSGGNVLRQWFTCYNGNGPTCLSTAVSSPITERIVTDQYGSSGLQCRHIYFYNSVGGLTEQDDYDYGSGGPGGLLRQILVTFASLPPNIAAFQQQVTVKNGSGTILSQTNYNYDENTPGSTASWGITQHVSVTGSRGNLTSINYPVSGLTSHFTYWDTGALNTSQGVNNATTTYNYGTSTTANCNGAFPVSISEPLSMSRSMTWNCTGGVQLTATDENLNTSTTAYTDSYFWRPASTTDPSTAAVSVCYGSLSSSTGTCTLNPTQVESTLNFNSNASTVDTLVTVDGLGRQILQQKRQGPSSTSFDSVETAYDALGRLYWQCLPYSGTAGQTNSSCPSVNDKYDALGRITSTTYVPGGGYVNYTYTNNDVLVTVGPAPSGENLKQRQLEYDSIGRLTSVCELTTLSGSGTCSQNTSRTGYWTQYTYDALGNLTRVSQNGQVSSGCAQSRCFSYDAMSRLTSETNPESGTKTYVYDTDSTMCGNGPYTSNGDLLKTIDANGNCVMRYYDARHRVTDVGSSSGCRRFRYDNSNGVLGSKPSGVTVNYPLGRLAEAETDTCASPITQSSILTDEWFSYTNRGELSDSYESTPHSGTYYHAAATYWANAALNQLNAYIGSTLNYSAAWNLDGEARPYSDYPVTGTTYNAASQPTQVNFSWGDSDSYTYDPNTGRMTQYKFTVGSTPQSVVGNLTWNANGTLSQLAITDPFNSASTQTCKYGDPSASPAVIGYDDLNRLVSANCGSAAAQTFSYDPFGNITKNGSPYSFNPTYSASTNRMTAIGSFTPMYDNDGNVTNDNIHAYAWDAYGNSTTLDSVGLTFDAFDRMVEQNRSGAYTQIVYSPTGFKMQILNGQTVARNFVPLAGGGTAVYNTSALQDVRHPDWLGSSRFASTTSRTMYFDTAYAPFGEPYASTGTTDLNFTGMNADTTSGSNNPDYDFLYREYSIQGRWAQPDPAGLAAVDPTNPQSWNRYAYVLNNPLSAIDPFGLDCVYLNDAGNKVEFVDSGSDQGECQANGGYWANGYIPNDNGEIQSQYSVIEDPNSDNVIIYSILNGEGAWSLAGPGWTQGAYYWWENNQGLSNAFTNFEQWIGNPYTNSSVLNFFGNHPITVSVFLPILGPLGLSFTGGVIPAQNFGCGGLGLGVGTPSADADYMVYSKGNPKDIMSGASTTFSVYSPWGPGGSVSTNDSGTMVSAGGGTPGVSAARTYSWCGTLAPGS